MDGRSDNSLSSGLEVLQVRRVPKALPADKLQWDVSAIDTAISIVSKRFKCRNEKSM